MSARVGIWGLVVLLAGLLPSACGSSSGHHAAVNVPDATPTPEAGDAEAGDAEAGPPLRTIETRSRFGSLDPANKLLDGDFEYSGMDTEQYPWFNLDYTWIVTGAACRHGLRCARIPAGNYIAGVFVWPSASHVDVEFFAKPGGSGTCTDDVVGLLTPLDNYAGAPPQQLAVMPSSATPGSDGWCDVKATLAVPTDTGNTFWGLIIGPKHGSTDSILVDDASLRGTNTSSGTSATRALARAPYLDALAARARADFAKRPPFPPRGGPAPVKNRTGRRLFVR